MFKSNLFGTLSLQYFHCSVLRVRLLRISQELAFDCQFESAGADDGEVPPVPIPNTVVKLTCAENTWGAAPWEDR